MPGIFISYRREDSSGYAGRLFDILVAHFGRKSVFMDLDTIQGGDNFTTVIEEKIGHCDVLLAIIGDRWLSCTCHDGTRRLDRPEDFVRMEIARALAGNVRVIPILVGSAAVPPESDLPSDLRTLSLRHAMDLRDAHFREDAQKLVDVLDSTVPGIARRDRSLRANRLLPSLGFILAVVAVAAAGYFFWHGKTSPQTVSQPNKHQTVPAVSPGAPAPAPANPSASQTGPPLAQTPPSSHSGRMASDPAIKPAAAATSPTASNTTTAPPSQLAGVWKATVTYDWPGAVYPETFKFEVDGAELSGTASLLQAGRAIVSGRIDGNRITFKTRTQTELDDKTYQDENNYKGTVDGDTIQFTMLTQSDASEHVPIHFTAKRVPGK